MNPLDDMQQRWQGPPPYERQPGRQALPGLLVLAVIVSARLLGLFQGLELRMLDTLLRWRPAEPTDERILIIGVNEADIQSLGTYPIPDGTLAELVQILSVHQPRAIGIDIFRDRPTEPGHQTWLAVLENQPNVIAIETVIGNPPVPPPKYLPPEQVGFVDLPLDDDGFVRRVLLGVHGFDGIYRYSFSLILAERYLATQGLFLENGVRDPWAKRFGDIELTRVHPRTGGYVRADANSNQMLLNPRSGSRPFRMVSLQQALAGEVEPAWIEDAIVIVGTTALGNKDQVNSAAIISETPGLINGVELHAHTVSQIIHGVLDGRPLLRTWPEGWEYLWIIGWGSLAIALPRLISLPARYVLVVGLAALGLVGICYGVLWLWGGWMPLVPALVVFTVNGLLLPGFYLYDQTLRSRLAERQRVIEERQRVIEQTYNAIHNGPLQTLAVLLRDAGEHISWSEALPKLQGMNQELRTIYENLLSPPDGANELEEEPGQGLLQVPIPLHEQLCELYAKTLERDFPGFASLTLKVVSFEPLNTDGLRSDECQAICHFFEEALCNVGKHAVNVTRLTINCCATATENLIQVEDNGKGNLQPGPSQATNRASLKLSGRGTRQAEQLARRLGGTFHRYFTAAGTKCELRWPLPSGRAARNGQLD